MHEDTWLIILGFLAFVLFCSIGDYNGAAHKYDRERFDKVQDRMEMTQ